VMLAGPKRAVSGPNRAAPVGPGHRGQLARLISERPLFVNVANGRGRAASIGRNWSEYINFCGVFFTSKDGGARGRSLDAGTGRH
jgi:hypothetical protein